MAPRLRIHHYRFPTPPATHIFNHHHNSTAQATNQLVWISTHQCSASTALETKDQLHQVATLPNLVSNLMRTVVGLSRVLVVRTPPFETRSQFDQVTPLPKTETSTKSQVKEEAQRARQWVKALLRRQP
jgi:hypothetical protein